MFFVNATECLHHCLQLCFGMVFLSHPKRVKRAKEKILLPLEETLLKKLRKTFGKVLRTWLKFKIGYVF